MLDALRERWKFAANTYKPFPCGIVMHAIIDAALALRDAHALIRALRGLANADDVAGVMALAAATA